MILFDQIIRRQNASIGVALTVLALLGGCTRPIAKGVDEKADLTPLELPCRLPSNGSSNPTAATNYKASIVLDGSVSMAGYVKNSNSNYVNMLKLLDGVSSARGSENVDYFRLDDGRKPIDRAAFRQSFGSAFYTGKVSKIADAFGEPPKPNNPSPSPTAENRLIAIVTDLLPDDGDITAVRNRIADKYLKTDGNGMALLGIRSEFDGVVYPPNNKPGYPFKATSVGEGSGRPFYILLVGETAAIQDFENRLRADGKSNLTHSQWTVFSANRTSGKIIYADAPLGDIANGVKTPESLSLDGTIVETNEQPIKLIEFSENSNGGKPIRFKYTLPYTPGSDGITVADLEARLNTKKNDSEATPRGFKPVEAAPIKVISSVVATKGIEVELEIDPANTQTGLYYTTIDLVAKGSSASSSWDKWNDGTAEGKDGNRTQGLLEFVKAIATSTNATSSDRPPTVARLCFGIQRN
jgi:hypothetical protein